MRFDLFVPNLYPALLCFFAILLNAVLVRWLSNHLWKTTLAWSVMATAIQKLGDRGEALVRRHFACLKCKRIGTLKPLIKNFKCADIICDFCGYLAQVKTNRVNDINTFPKSILGAGWLPQKERMDAGIFFCIFFCSNRQTKPKEFLNFLSCRRIAKWKNVRPTASPQKDCQKSRMARLLAKRRWDCHQGNASEMMPKKPRRSCSVICSSYP